MKFEYLIFNAVVIVGPLLLSFWPPIRYVRQWPRVFAALLPPAVYFVTWDILVTGRHWWFNHAYTMETRILNLPVGEWLFFITVPFSCLLIWESLAFYRGKKRQPSLEIMRRILWIGIPLGVLVFTVGKEYTGLVLITIGLLPLLEKMLKTSVLVQSNTYLFLAIVTGLIMIFNGYLTARPVVLYDAIYQLDWRVITIPVEDFGYGFAHLLMCVMLFERLKGRQA